MNSITKTIISNIIKIRTDKGLTQAAIADIINVDHTTYSKLESGQTKLSVDRLEEIASAFKMSVIDVLTYPEKYISATNISTDRKVNPKVVVQIELDKDKRDNVLKIIFGEENSRIINDFEN